MKSAFLILVLSILVPNLGFAASEKCIQRMVCENGELEVATKAGTSVDCVKGDYAIEVDPTYKWAEALGQSLHYASEKNLRAKVVLFCDETDQLCLQDKLRVESTIAHHELEIATEFLSVDDYKVFCPD